MLRGGGVQAPPPVAKKAKPPELEVMHHKNYPKLADAISSGNFPKGQIVAGQSGHFPLVEVNGVPFDFPFVVFFDSEETAAEYIGKSDAAALRTTIRPSDGRTFHYMPYDKQMRFYPDSLDFPGVLEELAAKNPNEYLIPLAEKLAADHKVLAEKLVSSEAGKEAIATNADKFFKVVCNSMPPSSAEMSGPQGMTSLFGSTEEATEKLTQLTQECKASINQMHPEVAMEKFMSALQKKTAAEGFPGRISVNMSSLGEVPTIESKPVLRADLLENSLPPLPGMADTVANKAGHARVSISDITPAGANSVLCTVKYAGRVHHNVRLPAAFAKSGNADYYVPSQMLENLGAGTYDFTG